MKTSRSSGFLYALVAAFLFGAGNPVSKWLLGSLDPWLLAGILYLGAGAGLLAIRCGVVYFGKQDLGPALKRPDLPWLLASTVVGGILAPVLLMKGLAETEASVASLFFNLETIFTVAIAGLVFKERLGGRFLAAMILMLGGSVFLSWTPHATVRSLLGPLLVAGACFGWAVDNNVTREISKSDPLQIGLIKCLVAGAVNIGLALWFQAPLPPAKVWAVAGSVGVFSYGVSLSCFIMALRHIGASRTSVFFSLVPFIGAGLSILFLGEDFSLRLVGAGLLMGLGAWVCITEKTNDG